MCEKKKSFRKKKKRSNSRVYNGMFQNKQHVLSLTEWKAGSIVRRQVRDFLSTRKCLISSSQFSSRMDNKDWERAFFFLSPILSYASTGQIWHSLRFWPVRCYLKGLTKITKKSVQSIAYKTFQYQYFIIIFL